MARYQNMLVAIDPNQDDQPALSGKIARLNPDMKSFAETPRDVQILDEAGKPVLGGDHERRFFEASWVFKRGGKYYMITSGCTGLLPQDMLDLYNRTPVNTKVIVLPS